MHPVVTAPPRVSKARDRILHAAAKVFARDGLGGATTRDIAKTAHVNEVTLFRHFGTKERLIAAVIGQTFKPQDSVPIPHTESLRSDLTAFAKTYESQLLANLPLVRTCLAEIHRHREQERQVLHAIFRPMRAALADRLEKAAAGVGFGPGLTAPIAADLFASMIFAGVLRQVKPMNALEYSLDQYRDAAVCVLLSGLGLPPNP